MRSQEQRPKRAQNGHTASAKTPLPGARRVPRFNGGRALPRLSPVRACAHEPGGSYLAPRFQAPKAPTLNVSAAGVYVGACPLARSAPVAGDTSGRRLTAWTAVRYRLPAGQVWLYAPNPRSWDSRYWGPEATADLVALAVPILTAPAAFRSTSGEPACGAARSAGPGSSPGYTMRHSDRFSSALPQSNTSCRCLLS
jgi:hypothetical protein